MIYCDLGHKVQSRRTLRNLCFAKEIYRHESMTYILAECDHFTLSEYLPVIVRRVAIYPTITKSETTIFIKQYKSTFT